MVYTGQVKEGVVVFDDAVHPPEGAMVRIEVVDEIATSDSEHSTPTLWQKLRKYSGVVNDLPSDMARNHDHYIHGGRKR